jgi:hypothetical protein
MRTSCWRCNIILRCSLSCVGPFAWIRCSWKRRCGIKVGGGSGRWMRERLRGHRGLLLPSWRWRQRRNVEGLHVYKQLLAEFLPTRPARSQQLLQDIDGIDRTHRRQQVACCVIQNRVRSKITAGVIHLEDILAPDKLRRSYIVIWGAFSNALSSSSSHGFTGTNLGE